MAIHRKPFCTDDELLSELQKLGYDEVSPEMFKTMKDDLSKLVQKELDNSSSLPDVSGKSSPPSIVDIDALIPEKLAGTSRLLSDAQKTGSHLLRKSGKSLQNKSIEGAIVKNKSVEGANVKNKSVEGAIVRNKSVEGAIVKKAPVIGSSISKYKSTLNNYKMKKNLMRTQPETVPEAEKAPKTDGSGNKCKPTVINHKSNSGLNKTQPSLDATCDKNVPSAENLANVCKTTLSDNDKKESITVTQEQIVDGNFNTSALEESPNDYAPNSNSNVESELSSENPACDKILSSDEDVNSQYKSVSGTYSVNDNVNEINNPSAVNEKISSIDDALDRYRQTLSKYKSREMYRKTLLDDDKVSPTLDFSVGKYREMMNKYRMKENLAATCNLSGLVGIGDIRPVTLSIGKYRDTLNNYKLKQNLVRTLETSAELSSSDIYRSTLSNSLTGESKTIKRKVLRHRNGRAVITEEILAIPNILNTSYPETDNFNSSKSFSSDDLSWHSNSSSGSVSGLSPHSMTNSHSSFSLSTLRSVPSRLPIPRKKKSDPVAMYNYYRRYWDSFKPPGEKTHDRLRWAVRDKMLEYNL